MFLISIKIKISKSVVSIKNYALNLRRKDGNWKYYKFFTGHFFRFKPEKLFDTN